MSTLPKIWALMDLRGTLSKCTFVRPSTDHGITILHPQDSTKSLRPRQMALRELAMNRNTAIPFHVHERKEKLYISTTLRRGLRVIIFDEGQFKAFVFNGIGDQIVVPAGCPHALICTEDMHFLVITTSQDSNDIEWEEDTEKLLKNEHLQPR